MVRVKVDQGRCVGAGLCVLAASEVFEQGDEDGLVKLLQERPPEALEQKVRNAARNCPSHAIKVEADETPA